MNPPVDNVTQLERDIARDRVSYDETLIRLYELRDRYNAGDATVLIGSAAARHREAHGHALTFGCCSTEASILAACEREYGRLLDVCEREVYGLPRSSRHAPSAAER